ncbi:MAG: MATE family efflux transporter [Dysgonomonas sp.]
MTPNQKMAQLEHGRIGHLLFSYAVPAIIGMLVSALYNIVDRIFVGQGVGPFALSGLTLTFPIVLFIQAFSMLVGIGASTWISIFLGKKAKDMAENVLGNAITLSIISAVLTTIPLLLFMDKLLYRFGASEQTLAYAIDYFYILLPFNFISIITFVLTFIMRASGYPIKSMQVMLIGTGLNVILNPVFIFGFRMGVQGAAIATVLSMFVGFVYALHHFMNKNSILRFHINYFSLRKQLVQKILSIGLSPFCMQLVGCIGVLIINRLLKQYGSDLAVGANGIISSFTLLLSMLVMGVAHGMQPIVGFNLGAGRMDRIQQVLKLSIISATVVTGLGWVMSLLIPNILVSAFSSNKELVSIASNGLHLTMLFFLPVGSQIIICQFFQSMGKAWKTIFLSLSRQCFFYIPTILIFSSNWGVNGIWLAQPFADVISVIIAWGFLIYFIKNKKKNYLAEHTISA